MLGRLRQSVLAGTKRSSARRSPTSGSESDHSHSSSTICAPRSVRSERAPNRSSSRCTRVTRASPRAPRSRCAGRGRPTRSRPRCASRGATSRPFVARGSGTGLAGGATPLGDPVVIVTTQMNRVLDVDPVARVAWVEPGVLNLDLSRDGAPPGTPLRARPVVAAGLHHRRATSPPTPAARTAWRPASRARTSSRSRSSSRTAR